MEKLKKRRLWLLAGIPGAGKTTWIANHKHFFAEDYKVVSRDKIRFELLDTYGDANGYFSNEKEVWERYVAEAKISLNDNTDTILDATHINEASRGKILRAIGSYLKDVEVNIIVINVTLGTALERNEMREGRAHVPESAIRRMASQMTLPSLEEGFDHIYIYEEENGKVKYQILENKE